MIITNITTSAIVVVNAAPFSSIKGIKTKFKLMFKTALTTAEIKNLFSRLAGNNTQYARIQLNTDASSAGHKSLRELIPLKYPLPDIITITCGASMYNPVVTGNVNIASEFVTLLNKNLNFFVSLFPNSIDNRGTATITIA